MPAFLDTLLSFTQRYVVFAGGALGAALLGTGIAVDPTTAAGAVFVGLGGSMFAAFVIALISLSRDDLLDALFRQGVVEVFSSRIVRCTDDHWSAMLAGASNEYLVLGVANHGYVGSATKRERYGDLFRAAIERGVKVEFLWLSPTTELARLREIEEGRATRKDTVNSILFLWGVRAGLEGDSQGRLVLREHEHMPSCGLTKADGQLTITHYVPGQDNQDAPGWILTAAAYPFYRRALAFLRREQVSAELVRVYLNTYREVRAGSKDITESRIEELRAKLPDYEVGKPSEADNRQERFPEVD